MDAGQPQGPRTRFLSGPPMMDGSSHVEAAASAKLVTAADFNECTPVSNSRQHRALPLG